MIITHCNVKLHHETIHTKKGSRTSKHPNNTHVFGDLRLGNTAECDVSRTHYVTGCEAVLGARPHEVVTLQDRRHRLVRGATG